MVGKVAGEAFISDPGKLAMIWDGRRGTKGSGRSQRSLTDKALKIWIRSFGEKKGVLAFLIFPVSLAVSFPLFSGLCQECVKALMCHDVMEKEE